MGGRYGANSDGSSDYQSRRPSSTDTDDDRTDAQQTIAEAVRSVQERRQSGSTQRPTSSNSSSSGGGSDTHGTSKAVATTASLSLRAATNRVISSTISVDERVADVIASSVVTQIQNADERILDEDDGRFKF